MSMQERKQLVELVEKAPQGALDDLVHDIKGQEAAAINNDGAESQVYFLMNEGCSADDIRAAVVAAEEEVSAH